MTPALIATAICAAAAILKDRFPNLTAKESIAIAGKIVTEVADVLSADDAQDAAEGDDDAAD